MLRPIQVPKKYKAKRVERIVMAVKRNKKRSTLNPWAVAQSTYYKSMAKGLDAFWLRVRRGNRHLLSVLVNAQSASHAARKWLRNSDSKVGDVVDVYRPHEHLVDTYVLKWRP